MPFNFAQSFFKMCQKFPDHSAVYTQNRSYSYKELYEAVEGIYRLLLTTNVKANAIGVYTFPNLQTAASILAISAYGSAYVPINPKFPIARNCLILQDSEIEFILSSEELKDYECQVLLTDDLPKAKTTYSFDLPPIVEQDLAYVLYTSGSTGLPKGVPLSKENLGELFNFFLQEYDFNENDRFLQNFEWTFDASVWSFLLPLITGGSTYLLSGEGIKFVAILKALQEHKITAVLLVPSVLALGQKYLKELHFPELRFCVFGGEALSHSLLTQWKKVCPNARMENHYGLTEASVHISRYVWEEERSAKESYNDIVPIGKIYPNTDFLIIDEQMENCPVGVPGDLCLAGPQIVNHYVNNVEPDRFFDRVENGVSKHYFRTGDLVKLNENGNLLYVGRNDEQVQIQGHRVELKEIEFEMKKLLDGPAAVVVHEDELNRKTLIAFVEEDKYSESQIKEKLEAKLGFYMIPKRVIVLKEMPLSINGKIKKKELLNMYSERKKR